jgi:hypothetical protein
MAIRDINDVITVLQKADRSGADFDMPEGSRYITLSATLAARMIAALNGSRKRKRDKERPPVNVMTSDDFCQVQDETPEDDILTTGSYWIRDAGPIPDYDLGETLCQAATGRTDAKNAAQFLRLNGKNWLIVGSEVTADFLNRDDWLAPDVVAISPGEDICGAKAKQVYTPSPAPPYDETTTWAQVVYGCEQPVWQI